MFRINIFATCQKIILLQLRSLQNVLRLASLQTKPMRACFRLVHRVHYSIGEQQQLPDKVSMWMVCIHWLLLRRCAHPHRGAHVQAAARSMLVRSVSALLTPTHCGREEQQLDRTWKMIQWLMMLDRTWWLTAIFAVICVCIPSVSRTHNWIKVGCCALEKT